MVCPEFDFDLAVFFQSNLPFMFKYDGRRLMELASVHNGICLDTIWQGTGIKYKWQCHVGHQWMATATNVKYGQWCPHCYGNFKKNTEFLKDVAARRGGKCLSTTYTDIKGKYSWECHLGHQWMAAGEAVQRGQWCPHCSGNARKDIEWLRGLAERRNGKCLSTSYVNNPSKYLWECRAGHTWIASANNVARGTWCPSCHYKASKAQIFIYDIVRRRFSDAILCDRTTLKLFSPNPSVPYELDISIPSLRKAIEYDGTYWHSLQDAKERDKKKNTAIKSAGYSLLRLKEEDGMETNARLALDFVLGPAF
jgi:hypothetical protein